VFYCFPHYVGDWPNSRKLLDEMFAGVPDEERYQITCGNVVDFFGLGAQRPVAQAAATPGAPDASRERVRRCYRNQSCCATMCSAVR
jgi:hypothetical protein